MFKVLILVLVSFCFSLSLVKEANTSSCYYRLDGSTWYNKDTTFNYVDADNKTQSINIKYGEVKLVPYLNNSIIRGEVYYFSRVFNHVGDKLFRFNLFIKCFETANIPITYSVFEPISGQSITKTIIGSTNKVFSFVGAVPNSVVSFTYDKTIYTSAPLTTEGSSITINVSGVVTLVPSAYFYVKNATTQSQTVSYTSITGYDSSIVCPANSVTEVTYGANNTSVWIGSVRYNSVQLGDKIIISNTPPAVEVAQTNKLNPLTVYPNPCNGTLNINLNSKSDIRIFTLDGKLVHSFNNVSSVKADALLNGVYLVSAKQGGVEMRKMITVAR